MTSTTPLANWRDDRLDIVDALYRFAAGQDRRDRDVFLSAFTDDATLDFVQPAARFGIDLPVFSGRRAIAEILPTLATIDTTHTVTNPRTRIDGDRAQLEAMVEAQHVSRDTPPRHLLLKNLFDVDLRRDDGRWLIVRLVIRTVWSHGDPTVLLGPEARDDGVSLPLLTSVR